MNKILKEKGKEIIDLYNSGEMNTTDICKKYKIASSTLSYFFKRNNVKKQCLTHRQITMMKNIDYIESEVIKLWDEGLSLIEIQKKLEIPDTTFRKYNLHKLVDTTYFHKRNCKQKQWNFFKNINTELKAYLLGILYTDGSVNSKNYAFRLEVSTKDIYLINLIKNSISPDSKIYNYSRVKVYKDKEVVSKTSAISIDSKEIHQDLINLGIVPNKTYIKSSLPNIPKELMRHFIRGCFDGDGSIFFTKGRPSVNFTGEPNFIKELSMYLKKEVGINPNLKIHIKSKQFDNCFKFSSLKDVILFQYFIYNNASFYLERKHKKFLSINAV